MDNKYYTPDVSELYVGFECMFRSAWLEGGYDESEDADGFKNLIIDTSLLEYWLSHYEFIDKNKQVRVKYLDKEDIESLGFKFTKNGDSHTEGSDWHFDYEFIKDGLFKVDIQYLNWMANDVIYTLVIVKRDNDIVFKGRVKNKSELIQILKKLRIDG